MTFYDETVPDATVTVTGGEPVVDFVIDAIETDVTVTPDVLPIALSSLIETSITVTPATPETHIHWGVTVDAAVYPTPTPVDAQVILTNPVPTGSPVTGNSSLVMGCKANQSMIDKMARCTIQVDNALTLPSDYFQHFEMKMIDYADVIHTVFHGFFPSGSATYGADGQYETLTAYDFAWYLTMQFLTRDNMVLMTPENQLAAKKYQLFYDHCYHSDVPSEARYWNVGDVITGATTGHQGRILENYLLGSSINSTDYPWNLGSYVILEIMTTGAGPFFQDDEYLNVNGLQYAQADGYTLDVTGTIQTVLPHHYVYRLLGGDDTGSQYEKLTGILPYRITPVDWSATSDPIAVEFDFEEKTTKAQAIERIAKYIRYIHMIKGIVIGSVAYTAEYFVPESTIDDANPTNNPALGGLDLPDPVYIDPTDAYLVSPVTLDRKGEERYNKVTVRCQSLAGIWYESVLPIQASPDVIPIEYYELNQDIASQAECDARCTDLYAYYANQIQTWTANFILRADFRLLQKLIFTGSVTGIPAGTYRIIGIDYETAHGGVINDVSCKLILDSQFKFWLNLNRTFTDTITEVQNLIHSELDKMGQDEDAIVLSVDAVAGTMTVRNAAGVISTIRNPAA